MRSILLNYDQLFALDQSALDDFHVLLSNRIRDRHPNVDQRGEIRPAIKKSVEIGLALGLRSRRTLAAFTEIRLAVVGPIENVSEIKDWFDRQSDADEAFPRITVETSEAAWQEAALHIEEIMQ